ncbi:MAG: lipoprotein LpqH [Mycobacterium sp.]|nr:lipoprotein LpqH [Mycobacterium sp.]
MRHEVAIGGAAAALLIGIVGVGCASDKTPMANNNSATSSGQSSPPSSTAVPSASASATGNPSSSQAEVTVDGVKQNLTGTATCTNLAGNFNIAIGQGVSGVAVVLSQDATTVHSVGLGNISGVILGFQQGISGGQATVSKDGNTYTVSGTATGITAALPPAMVSKSFEIKVTCP